MFIVDGRQKPVKVPGPTLGVGQKVPAKKPVRPAAPKAPAGKRPARPAPVRYGKYVASPRPLTPQELAEIAESTAGANREYQTSLAEQAAGVAESRRQLTSGLMSLDNRFYNQRQDTGDELGSVGLGRNPAFAGKALSRLRDQQLADSSAVRTDAAQREAALQKIVEQALARKRDTDARNARNKGRYGADILAQLRSVL